MPYYCEICNYVGNQKSHIDSHIKTREHLGKAQQKKNILRSENISDLLSKYEVSLRNSVDDFFEDIVNNLSQKKISDLEANKINLMNTNRFISQPNSTYDVKFSICHELTQFTHGKTEQTLNMINGLIEKYYINSNDSNFHQIEIIISNNSLLETEQWKIRTKNKLGENEYIDVEILSSKSDSDYKYIDNFLTKILTAKTKNDLPNILIVCAHKKRVCRDIIKLLRCFSGTNYINIQKNIKFHFNFDEPDSYLGILCDFLTEFKEYSYLISEILFITATPYDHFWKILQSHRIHELYNIAKDSCVEKSYNDYFDSYMSINEHNYLEYNYQTKNPLEYIENIFENYKDINNGKEDGDLITFNPNERKIIFAPGHLYTTKLGYGSHAEIVEYFLEKNYIIFLSNGKFKGFIYPNGNRILLKDFNIKYGIKGELRDSLRKLNELHPTSNIAITGYWTIERGITFNTDGFNFTDVIISDYHANNINRLIQLVGRSTGNKKYVNKMNLICPTKIYNIVDEFVNKTRQLRELNHANYNRADFSNKDSAIPVRIEFLHNEFRKILFNSITNKRGYKVGFDRLLKLGIEKEFIKLYDRNNSNKFLDSLQERKIKTIRVFKEGQKGETRRFKQFSEAFDTFKPVSQSGTSKEYNIDLTSIEYNHDGFINGVNIAWITYKL